MYQEGKWKVKQGWQKHGFYLKKKNNAAASWLALLYLFVVLLFFVRPFLRASPMLDCR